VIVQVEVEGEGQEEEDEEEGGWLHGLGLNNRAVLLLLDKCFLNKCSFCWTCNCWTHVAFVGCVLVELILLLNLHNVMSYYDEMMKYCWIIAKMMLKCCWSIVKMMLKCCENGAEMLLKFCWNIVKMMLESKLTV
jgi:hypothetical protein